MNKKQLQLVTYEQAKRLKQLGFDWKVTHFISHEDMNPDGEHSEIKLGDRLFDYNHFSDTFSAPAVALALKWIRDEKRLIFSIGHVHLLEPYNSNKYYGVYEIPNNVLYTDEFSSYESAENALLDELLTILEKEKEQ